MSSGRPADARFLTLQQRPRVLDEGSVLGIVGRQGEKRRREQSAARSEATRARARLLRFLYAISAAMRTPSSCASWALSIASSRTRCATDDRDFGSTPLDAQFRVKRFLCSLWDTGESIACSGHQAVDVAEAAELEALEAIDMLAVDEPLAMDDEALAVAFVILYDASTALKSVVTFWPRASADGTRAVVNV